MHIFRIDGTPGTHWDFTDQSGDIYGLTLFGVVTPYPLLIDFPVSGGWHKVSYNSTQPDIVKIFFEI